MTEKDLSEERIRVRAYEIFLRRGGDGGSPESDWLLAREELLREPDGAPQPARSGARAAAKTAVPVEEPAAPPKRSVRTVRTNTASRRSR